MPWYSVICRAKKNTAVQLIVKLDLLLNFVRLSRHCHSDNLQISVYSYFSCRDVAQHNAKIIYATVTAFNLAAIIIIHL